MGDIEELVDLRSGGAMWEVLECMSMCNMCTCTCNATESERDHAVRTLIFSSFGAFRDAQTVVTEKNFAPAARLKELRPRGPPALIPYIVQGIGLKIACQFLRGDS